MIQPSPVQDLKPFLPAKDFLLASQFYLDLGFTKLWGSEELAAFQIGEFRFLLQNYYAKEWAENFMMHLMVEDAESWWQHLHEIDLTRKYPDIMCRPPAVQPWGLRVLYLMSHCRHGIARKMSLRSGLRRARWPTPHSNT